jgi:hypothetical protein
METMRRGLIVLAGVGLLALVGCSSVAKRGECDCQVEPIGTGTPPPLIKAPPLGVAPANMPPAATAPAEGNI